MGRLANARYLTSRRNHTRKEMAPIEGPFVWAVSMMVVPVMMMVVMMMVVVMVMVMHSTGLRGRNRQSKSDGGQSC